MPELNQQSSPHLRKLAASYDRVTPIFRKTNTIMLGADAFSRAEDIEQAIYNELPRLFEQYATAVRDRDYWEGQARNRAFRNAQAENERLKEQLEVAEAILRLSNAPVIHAETWAEGIHSRTRAYWRTKDSGSTSDPEGDEGHPRASSHTDPSLPVSYPARES